MEANKAPEKVYLVIDPVWGSMSVNYNCNDANNIEYIRADAFIEKATKWLKENAANFVSKDNEGEPYLYRIGLADEFIKAMML